MYNKFQLFQKHINKRLKKRRYYGQKFVEDFPSCAPDFQIFSLKNIYNKWCPKCWIWIVYNDNIIYPNYSNLNKTNTMLKK